MKHLAIILSTLIVSSFALAANAPDLNDLRFADETGAAHGKMGECMKAGWDAAKATDAQNASLATLMTNLHNTIDANRDQVETAARDYFLTWGHHPVDKGAVHNAQNALDQAVYPIKTAITDTMVDGINLLTIEQRGAYDQAFGACMQGK